MNKYLKIIPIFGIDVMRCSSQRFAEQPTHSKTKLLGISACGTTTGFSLMLFCTNMVSSWKRERRSEVTLSLPGTCWDENLMLRNRHLSTMRLTRHITSRSLLVCLFVCCEKQHFCWQIAPQRPQLPPLWGTTHGT